jgi:transposase
MILSFSDGESVSETAARFSTNRMKVQRCIDKALELGVDAALNDLPGRGRPGTVSAEAKTWIISLACQKPKDLGYPYELWTTRLLAKHVRKECSKLGHDCVSNISKGTISKILSKHGIKSHKINCCLGAETRILIKKRLMFYTYIKKFLCLGIKQIMKIQ